MHVNEPANSCSSCQRLVQTAQCELLTENCNKAGAPGKQGQGVTLNRSPRSSASRRGLGTSPLQILREPNKITRVKRFTTLPKELRL